MSLKLSKPILYLITRGAGDSTTTPETDQFRQILVQVSSAVSAGIQLIQLREKQLTTRSLFELTKRAVELARGTTTKILVNDRADVARAALADGVHLTTQSLDAVTIRKTFGAEFIIGVSTHSLAEAQSARDGGADFVVFGPVFVTASKEKYGAPLGLKQLAQVAEELSPFPVLALGGVRMDNAATCLRSGASGIAGITLFGKPEQFFSIVSTFNERLRRVVR